jgi:hypothetical protein
MVLFEVVRQARTEQMLPVLLYIGPETLLPLTSALAAIFGVLLIAWHKVLAIVTKVWRLFLRNQ